jgi:hypothetical protein
VKPENDARVSQIVTFEWENGVGAENHRIEIDNNSDFIDIVENVVVYDNTFTTTLTYGIYWWRVWAINQYGENVSENTWTFEVVANWGELEGWTTRARGRTPTSLSISPSNFSLTSGSSLTLWATLTDNGGNPLANKILNWGATTGSLSASTTTTDSSGKASVSYTAPPSVTSTTSVTITVSFAGDENYLANQAQSTGQIEPTQVTVKENTQLFISPENFELDSRETMTFTAMLQDADNNPLVGKILNWSTNVDSLSAENATTDNSGRCEVEFKAPEVAERTQVTIKVTFAGDESYTSSEAVSKGSVKPKPYIPTTLRVEPSYLKLESEGHTELSALLLDNEGNHLANKSIEWHTDDGMLSENQTTTDNSGVATTTYTAPNVTTLTTVEIYARFLGNARYQPSEATVSCRVLPSSLAEVFENLSKYWSDVGLENFEDPIEEAIIENSLGACINIQTKFGIPLVNILYLHPNVTIDTITNGKIQVEVGSTTGEGKVVVVVLDFHTLPLDQGLWVLLDGQEIERADNYMDLLSLEENYPEQYTMIWENGAVVLVSVPTFTDEMIMIEILGRIPGIAWLLPAIVVLVGAGGLLSWLRFHLKKKR